jgi:hypothetical protein
VIYLRPYVRDSYNNKLYAYYPAYVAATTLDARPPLPITPTVPTLFPVPELTTDTTLTVKWLRQDDLQFTLRYSYLLSDYPNGGTVVPWEQISLGNDYTRRMWYGVDEETGEEFIFFEIPRLFPDTRYYIWLQARDPVSGNVSAWSNPIDMVTNDIEEPEAPKGFGLASRGDVNDYNLTLGTNYHPSDPDALIVTWTRIPDDPRDALPTGGTSVIVGEMRITAVEQLNLPPLDTYGIYLARFFNLSANTRYFLRAKTVVTVTRGSDGLSVRSYNYVVQLSPDRDFKDYIEFTIPPMPPLSSLDPVFTKRKESGWVRIELVTAPSGGEFDGDTNPEQYPLPEQDWEITYDRVTDTLNFRFRSNQKDAQGQADQNVDQRFVSRLIAERVYTSRLDVSAYNNRAVENSVVEIPYSVLRSFHERRISLEINANNLRVTIAPGALATAEVRALNPGVGASARITLGAASSAQSPGTNKSFASTPRSLKAEVVTPTRTVNISQFAQPVALRLRLESRVVPMETNVGMYYSSSNTGGWQSVAATYSGADNALTHSAVRTGSYAAVSAAAPAQVFPYDATRDAYLSVSSRTNITDMRSYYPNERVTANAFNNLIAALALGRPQVAIYAPLSAGDEQTLRRARMYVSNATREQALAAAVALYEVKMKRTVQTYGGGPPDIASVSAEYRAAVIKAYELGMFTGNARPGDTLTMGEMMTFLSFALY